MEEIIKRIKSGEISRDNDEAYAGGFWDYANDIVGSYIHLLNDEQVGQLQEELYNDFWEIYEKTLQKRI